MKWISEVKSRNEIEMYFFLASTYPHRNKKNYTRTERIDDFLKFYVLREGDLLLAFSAIYKFNEVFVRVLDSTFYFPSIRIRGGNYFGTASEYFLPAMTKYAKDEGYTPFFSIQSDRPHRRSMKRIVENFNEKNKGQYKVLDGYHWTCRGKPDPQNDRCWQTVAICGDYGSSLWPVSKSRKPSFQSPND